jgi:DNA-binding SARP family transcriptional activator
MDALWPDVGTDIAAPRLHKAAHHARRALGLREAVVLNANEVALCPGDEVWVDMVHFRRRAEDVLGAGGSASAEAALALYRGELLPRDLYEPWAELERIQLRRLHLELLHKAEDWHGVLAADPADESAHIALARRYAERGDRVRALRQLDQLDHVMREALGLRPSERALDLRRQVTQPASSSIATEPRGAGREAPACPSAELPQHCCASVPIAR